MYDFSTPTWKQVGELQQEVDTLHKENALKLQQILELEEILYDNRILDEKDGSPCWCAGAIVVEEGDEHHSFACHKARKATKMFWNSPASTEIKA